MSEFAHIATTHRGETEGWDGETVCGGLVGVCSRGRSLQRVLQSGGAQIAIRLAVSCFNKRRAASACDHTECTGALMSTEINTHTSDERDAQRSVGDAVRRSKWENYSSMTAAEHAESHLGPRSNEVSHRLTLDFLSPISSELYCLCSNSPNCFSIIS